MKSIKGGGVSAVRTPHVTNNPVMTRNAMMAVLLDEFDTVCDTAVSHSMLPGRLYRKLQQKLVRRRQ